MTRPTHGICETIGKWPAQAQPSRAEAETAVTIYRFAPELFPNDQARAVQLAEPDGNLKEVNRPAAI